MTHVLFVAEGDDFYLSLNIPLTTCEMDVHCEFELSTNMSNVLLWYVSQRAIFGAGMGRDDGYYCDVLSSGVNLFVPCFIPSTGHMAIIISSNIHYTSAHIVADTKHLQKSYI